MQKKFGAELKTPNDLSVPQYEGDLPLQGGGREGGLDRGRRGHQGASRRCPSTGPRGTIQMNKQHHAPLTMYLGQVQGDGAVKVLKTFPNVDPGEQCPNLEARPARELRAGGPLRHDRSSSSTSSRRPAILFLVAAGLLIVFGVMKIINFAHGAFLTHRRLRRPRRRPGSAVSPWLALPLALVIGVGLRRRWSSG